MSIAMIQAFSAYRPD
jgi:hypothetical protein